MPAMHRARKRFGQNFLNDPAIIAKIINAIDPKPNEKLIEIGPGQGALTLPLLEQCHELTAIEIDRDLVALLNGLDIENKLTIISQDVLKVNFVEFPDKLRIVGNLPYNISTPIMLHLLKLGTKVLDMHFMLQKELVDRLAAQPGCKDYGRLSVLTQFRCKVVPLFNVAPGCFSPAPKVMSSIVRLYPKQLSDFENKLYPVLHDVAKQAFAMRRKTLKNNLKGVLTDSDYQELDIDPKVRAEQLTIDDFVRIATFVLNSSERENVSS